MTIGIKKPLTKSKLEEAEKKLIEKRSKKRGFDAKKFSGKLKGVFGDPLKYQKKLRGKIEVQNQLLKKNRVAKS